MRKVILLTAMPKESVWSSSIYVNGGGKIAFCVKHNLISTFFNFVLYCTLVFIMCFLTAGNICAQTTLSLTANVNDNVEVDGTKVMFKDDGTIDNNGQTRGDYIGFSYVGGAKWAKPFTSGETHTFTVTLNSYSGTWRNQPVVKELHIAALKCEITNANHQQSLTNQIVAEACIELPENSTESLVLTLEVNEPYEAVYLYKKNRTTDWEYVDIASVTRTVETPVVISEEAVENSITAQTGATVNLYRSLTAYMWNTICLPFAPTQTHVDAIFGPGAKFAQFSSVSNGVMQFTSVNVGSLEAGKPYLVLPTKSQIASSPIKLTNVTIPTTALEPAEPVTKNGYSFVGTYTKKSFVKDDHTIRFVAANNKLKYPNTENPLKALRAYFTVPVPGGSGASTGAKDYTFEVDSFVPTSIANIQIEGDGDGAIYNIGGQRVEGKSLPKGIYIRDGKKFVVK